MIKNNNVVFPKTFFTSFIFSFLSVKRSAVPDCYRNNPHATRIISINLMNINGATIPPNPYIKRFLESSFPADTSRYFTPLSARGINATIIRAL